MRILITGGSGLLGFNWAAALRDGNDVLLGTHARSVHLAGTRSIALALDQPPAFQRQLAEAKPDLVVHAAGLSSVDGCERQPELAFAINAELARTVAAATRAQGIALVHISTDHIFSGERALYTEADAPRPLNAYARSKLEGERLVAAACPGALIVRTNFFGWGPAGRQSISDWILAGLRARTPLTMFTDVYFTPILASRLATRVQALVEAGASGVLHVAGEERISKHAFALRLAAAFGLQADTIREGRFADAQLAAPRPRDMSLSCERARSLLGHGAGGLDEHLAALRAQERSGLAAELKR